MRFIRRLGLIVICFCILFMLCSHKQAVSDKIETVELKESDFDSCFDFVDTLTFDFDSLFIKAIWNFVAVDNNHFFIRDLEKFKLIYIDYSRKKFEIIDPEKVFPGLKTHCFCLVKDRSDNSVWCFYSPNYAINFKVNDGKLLMQGHHFEGYALTDPIGIGCDNHIYFSDGNPSAGYSLFSLDITKNKKEKVGNLNFNDQLLNAISIVGLGGCMLVDSENNCYISNSIENRIFRFDNASGEFSIIHSGYNDYQLLEKDYPSNFKSLPRPVFDSFREMAFLKKDCIIANYLIQNTPQYELFFISHDKCRTKKLKNNKLQYLLFADDSVVYMSIPMALPSDSDMSFEIRNPVVVRYKIKSSCLMEGL
ncbi:MAG: hypothetical protein KBA26_00315 [Candidatus Delongbacteria bacterium]|nr:hypothetical protein [Candidatus Delongbacteria bacterium]